MVVLSNNDGVTLVSSARTMFEYAASEMIAATIKPSNPRRLDTGKVFKVSLSCGFAGLRTKQTRYQHRILELFCQLLRRSQFFCFRCRFVDEIAGNRRSVEAIDALNLTSPLPRHRVGSPSLWRHSGKEISAEQRTAM